MSEESGSVPALPNQETDALVQIGHVDSVAIRQTEGSTTICLRGVGADVELRIDRDDSHDWSLPSLPSMPLLELCAKSCVLRPRPFATPVVLATPALAAAAVRADRTLRALDLRRDAEATFDAPGLSWRRGVWETVLRVALDGGARLGYFGRRDGGPWVETVVYALRHEEAEVLDDLLAMLRWLPIHRLSPLTDVVLREHLLGAFERIAGGFGDERSAIDSLCAELATLIGYVPGAKLPEDVRSVRDLTEAYVRACLREPGFAPSATEEGVVHPVQQGPLPPMPELRRLR